MIQALPTYVMQTAILPKAICDEVDKICRGFIWGESYNGRKVHLVSWEKVCKPKQYGGLGLRKARDVNMAFIMKAGWRLCTQRDALWNSVVRKKYKCGDQVVPLVDTTKQGNNFWRGVCCDWNSVLNNTI